jgi:hypothetical protein|tara:strand:- start:4927 stop:5268 length:342 start_codon:yes stop_codon:yes gene_type:complete
MSYDDTGAAFGKEVPVYAPTHSPVAYADTVTSFAYTSEVAKFYFARFDPSANGVGGRKTEIVAQVVMPLEAFAGMTLFFQKMLEVVKEGGAISDEQIQQLTRALDSKSDEQNG